MQEKILDFLKRKQEYLSGEEISQHLGISRQGLWKHIQELKEAGYEIVAVPHLGYRLISSPDRLFPSEVSSHLNTKLIGRNIRYFDQLPSTMNIATELALKDAPEGTIVLSESQSRGRGRLGREWFSPRYKGIYLSLILRPKILPGQAAVLNLLAAVSICEAIKEITGLNSQIKWPNDILLGSKKIGGILTELNAEMDAVRFIIIGIGLNVNNDKKSLLSGATSLREEKKEDIGRLDLLKAILRSIEGNYFIFQKDGAHPVLNKWRHFNLTLGRRVKISSHKEQIEAEAIDIDTDGALLLRNDAGLMQRITAGDVVHCR